MSEYYLIQVSDGFRQASYHLASNIEQLKSFTDKHGYEYGIIRTRVYGPIKVNEFSELDFQTGKWIGHAIEFPET
jgi:hypothetical protein